MARMEIQMAWFTVLFSMTDRRLDIRLVELV